MAEKGAKEADAGRAKAEARLAEARDANAPLRKVAIPSAPRTKRTSLVPPLVLSGHAASLTPY